MKKTALKRKQPLSRKSRLNSTKRQIGGNKRKPRGQLTPAKLKKELDRVFSLYIRGKYEKSCYTCGRTGTLQNGHFISRQYLATRWDENNCRPQCVGCNIYGNGKPLDFEERLKKELGDNLVEEMKKKRHTITKVGIQWYKEQIELYKSKIKT